MSRKVKVRANHLRLIILLNTWFGLYTVVWLDERNAVDDVVSVAVLQSTSVFMSTEVGGNGIESCGSPHTLDSTALWVKRGGLVL